MSTWFNPTSPAPTTLLTGIYNAVTPLVTTATITINALTETYFLGNPSGTMGLTEFWNWQSGNLPDGTQVNIYTSGDPNNPSSYNIYFSDSGSPSFWDDSNGNPLAVAPTLAQGQSFFILPAAPTPLIFLGTGSFTAPAVSGSDLRVVGSDGIITALPDGTALTFWNGSMLTPTDIVDSTSPSGFSDTGGNPLPSAPSLPIASGFFIQLNGGPTNPSLIF